MRTYILYNYSTGMLTNWLRKSNFIFKFNMLTWLHLHLRLSTTVISKRQNLQFLALWTNLRSWFCFYIEFSMDYMYTRFYTKPFTVTSKRQNLQFKPKIMFLFTYCVSNRRFKTKLNGIKTISFICYFLLYTNENDIHLKTINYWSQWLRLYVTLCSA